ncbi:unnamed protein product [Sphagnum balticum]
MQARSRGGGGGGGGANGVLSRAERSLAFASASRGQACDLLYGSQWTVQMHPIGTAAEASSELSLRIPPANYRVRFQRDGPDASDRKFAHSHMFDGVELI